MKIYLIPGVGSDHRLFENFKLPDHEICYLDFQPFGDSESLPEYAQVMAKKVNQEEPFALLGVSLGGMIAVEMAKFLNPTITILVSSAKTHKEFPPKIKLTRGSRVYYLGWGGLLKWFSLKTKFVLGARGGGNAKIVTAMMKDTTNAHLRKSILALLNWRNLEIHSSIVHIHGTNDWTLPHKHVSADYYIKDGTHLMIYDKAEEISTLANELLQAKN